MEQEKLLIPTEQQQEIINYTDGHSRVLAVAGSGKTTTMVLKVMHLIGDLGVPADRIGVFMFNRAARIDFSRKYKAATSMPPPNIHTFHALAFRIIEKAVEFSLIPKPTYWTMQNEWISNQKLVDIRRKLLRESPEADEENFDIDVLKTSISWWKNNLIPPAHAGHNGNPVYEKAYRMYEDERIELNALTFDDFAPLAIELVKKYPEISIRYHNKYKQIILDEYQDINESQQKLIEQIAGSACITAVGDDDQTIYEWRGARPEYILTQFEDNFAGKPHQIFHLDATFRFGPILSQCASNTIQNNLDRHEKEMRASVVKNDTSIEVKIRGIGNYYQDPSVEFTQEIYNLVRFSKVHPSEIRVLGRLYSQFTEIEGIFLAEGIPYFIDGGKSINQKKEIRAILDYTILAELLHDEVNDKTIEKFQNILNFPNRKLRKDPILKQLKTAKATHQTLYELLLGIEDSLLREEHTSLQAFSNLFMLLRELHLLHVSEIATKKEDSKAYRIDKLMQTVLDKVDFASHFNDLHGQSEEAQARLLTMQAFVSILADDALGEMRSHPSEFEAKFAGIDTKRGLPEESCVGFSTIYKTKGLEYDYVFIPSCNEGMLPFIPKGEPVAYDRRTKLSQNSASLEAERRLFYVGITRARKKVYIGATSDLALGSEPSQFLDELQYREVTALFNNLVHNVEHDEKWESQISKMNLSPDLVQSFKKYLHSAEIYHKDVFLDGLIEKQKTNYKKAVRPNKVLIAESLKQNSDSEDIWADLF